MAVSIILFVLAGVVFGYALRSVLGWIVPLGLLAVIALLTGFFQGFDAIDGTALVVTFVLTALGVLLGRVLGTREHAVEPQRTRRA